MHSKNRIKLVADKKTKITRRKSVNIIGTLAAGSMMQSHLSHSMEQNLPKIKRFKMATISVTDLKNTENLYKEWIGYEVCERGIINKNLANSWNAEKSEGSPYILMQPKSKEDVYIRAILTNPVKGYKAMTTWGWNAIEIICENPDSLNNRLVKSPFTIIGNPAPLKNYPSIRAMQIQGPDQDVIYLTTETGDRDNSLLPKPESFVGRIFIMVVAGPDILELQNWYSEKFNMKRKKINNSPVELINRAQGIDLNSERPLTTLNLAQHGNLLELDGYGSHTGPRPKNKGELPPGISITSITVDKLNELNLNFISEPVEAYGSRAATVVGPAGELLELIEED